MPTLSAHRVLAAGIAVLLVIQVTVLVARAEGDGSIDVPPAIADVTRPAPPTADPSPSATPSAAASEAPVGTTRRAAPDASGSPTGNRGRVVARTAPATDDDPDPGAAPADPARARFEQRFPAHAAARQDPRRPATTRWAVLIGVNEHQGRTRDNVGSRQDAEDLAQHLLRLGWLEDHVLLLTDAEATFEGMAQAIAWLARKTDGDSVAVFHYSGHTKKWYGQDADGDGEVTDEGLWPSDNRFMIDSEWVARMAAVDAGRLWIDIGGCEAAGLNDPGLERPGRLLTFSSTESEKSYEWPGQNNSVWGYYLADQALLQGLGDVNGDGHVTVEEAFNYAAPRAAQRTDDQRYGAQHAVAIDHVEGDFDLRIPPTPPEPRPDPEPEPSDTDDEGDDGCMLLCTGTRSRRT